MLERTNLNVRKSHHRCINVQWRRNADFHLKALKGPFVLLNLFLMFYAATSQKLHIKHWVVLNKILQRSIGIETGIISGLQFFQGVNSFL